MIAKRLFCLYLGLLVFCAFSVAPPNAAAEDLLFESFEVTWPPPGWERLSFGGGIPWIRSGAEAHTGTYSALQPAFPDVDTWLVTSALDFSAALEPALLWWEASTNWASAGELHEIAVSTTSQTDPLAFTTLLSMTPANHTVAGMDGDPVMVSLGDYEGEPTVYIAFHYVGDSADLWFVDDVTVAFSLPAHDVFPVSISPRNQQYHAGDHVNPNVVVKNGGQNPESFDVNLQILETGTEVYSETMAVTDLEISEQRVVVFPQFSNFNDGNLYKFIATTLLASDLAPANDQTDVYNDSYTLQRVPLGMFFTNAGCAPCATANPILDNYMRNQGNDVALIRVHVSWPGSDGIYSANTVQSNALVGLYGVTGVPDLFVDNIPAGSWTGVFEMRKQIGSPSTLDLSWDPVTEVMTVVVQHHQPVPLDAEYRLRVSITEDNVYYNGGNGEPIHQQAFRRMYPYPSIEGVPVPATPGTHVINVPCPLGSWVYDQLRGTVYLQEEGRWLIHQAATGFLLELENIPLAAGDQIPAALGLEGNFPNPFNPSTTIAFSLPDEQMVDLSIYALDGSHVTTLVHDVTLAGRHEVAWEGRDQLGARVASGAYFYRLQTGDYSETQRMLLVK